MKVEIDGKEHIITRAKDTENTWRAMNADHHDSYYNPEKEQWSPMVTLKAETIEEAECRLREVLEWAEIRPDPLIPRRS